MQGQNLPPETIQALRTARAAGVTLRALTTQYGFTRRTIHRHTFGLGPRATGPRATRKHDLRTVPQIISLLLEFGSLNVREMTEKIGQTISFIYRKLKELREGNVVERFKLWEDDCRGRPRDFYRLTRAELGLM